MRTSRAVTLALVAFGWSACAPAGSGEDSAAAATNTAADIAAVGQVREAWVTAWKAGNAAGLAALYAPGAYDMANNTPTAVGPEGIEAANTAAFGQMTPTDLAITAEKTEVVGDLAYDRGTFKLALTPKAGGAAISDSGRFVAILRRQADGSWKIVELIGNSATPLPMPPGK
jgi:uncharacterized protein (TIGR02246 family)